MLQAPDPKKADGPLWCFTPQEVDILANTLEQKYRGYSTLQIPFIVFSEIMKLDLQEEFDFIEYTVVVKLTADELHEPPSAMRVVGAERHFKYGHAAGDAGCFLARLYHASVAPESDREHLKIAFFFKASGAGERRARLCTKRSDGQLEVGEARRIVFEDLSSSTVRGAR